MSVALEKNGAVCGEGNVPANKDKAWAGLVRNFGMSHGSFPAGQRQRTARRLSKLIGRTIGLAKFLWPRELTTCHVDRRHADVPDCCRPVGLRKINKGADRKYANIGGEAGDEPDRSQA